MNETERPCYTYFISRDSEQGALADECDIWFAKPRRIEFGGNVNWIPSSFSEPGHFGKYTIEKVRTLYGTYLKTNLELIKAEQYPAEPKSESTKRKKPMKYFK